MDLPTLDRHSVVPLYYQIQQHLLEQIRAGILKPGKPIPSEQEISARLRISRMTARQALKSLCDLGVTYSQRGKGTYVSTVKLEKNSRQVLSFSEEMQACGSRARSKVLSFEVATASPDAADALHLPPGEKSRAENQRLQFRWSVFNVTNTPRFDVYTLQDEWDVSNTFGNYTQTLTKPRVMEFALTYKF